jgi:ATP-dependent DNA ligase
MTVDAVMLYAQAGHGRRANLYTDFTFGVRDGNDLVPFTKAYSGLTDAEFAEITRWVQKNTLERFGSSMTSSLLALPTRRRSRTRRRDRKSCAGLRLPGPAP